MRNAENPDAMLWSLWACRETAYKIIKKTVPDIAFIPRRWQAVFKSIQPEYTEGEIVIGKRNGIYFRLFSNTEYVHCIGSDRLAALDDIIADVDILPEPQTDPSVFSRHCLTHRLAGHFSWDVNQISIRRTEINGELGPPRVYVGGRETDVDVSLSHDGRFVACAFAAEPLWT